jgi:MoxR-like ATPase
LKVPESFRIIATMNVYDRRYLFTLGYALLRRFAVVEVSNPGEDELRKVLSKRCGNEAVINELLELYQDLKNKNFELGIALLIDSVKLACAMAQSNEVKKAVDIAIKMVVVPQLEGLLPDQLKEIKDALKTRNYRESLNLFNRLYQEAEYGERSA